MIPFTDSTLKIELVWAKFCGNQIPDDWSKISKWIRTIPNFVYSRNSKLFFVQKLYVFPCLIKKAIAKRLPLHQTQWFTKNCFSQIVVDLKHLYCKRPNVVVTLSSVTGWFYYLWYYCKTLKLIDST